MADSFRFLHLGVHFESGILTTEKREDIESVLNRARDWFRYAPNCWLIYTAQDPPTWHKRLKEIPWIKEESYLICAVDLSEKSGWLRPSAWEWINRERPSKYGHIISASNSPKTE